jgi:hypothetical protein
MDGTELTPPPMLFLLSGCHTSEPMLSMSLIPHSLTFQRLESMVSPYQYPEDVHPSIHKLPFSVPSGGLFEPHSEYGGGCGT